jgi:hypothetical protein
MPYLTRSSLFAGINLTSSNNVAKTGYTAIVPIIQEPVPAPTNSGPAPV